MKLSFILTAALLSRVDARWWRGNHSGGNGGMTSATTTTSSATAQLDPEEEATILWMREEEKLARDVYLTLAQSYDSLEVFDNIADSEQLHMNQMKSVIVTYHLVDPVTDDTPIGVFQDGELQALYDSLILTGSQSLVEALKVGALIEEIDIRDLNEAMMESDQGDVNMVYSRLKRASCNHLRAFVRNLEWQDVTPYVSQHLPQTEVDAILLDRLSC